MPQVVIGAALAAAASAGATALTLGVAAITAASVLTSFAGSLILGGLSYALTSKPKSSVVSDIPSGTVSLKQSDLTRKFLYGHTRVTTGYAHMESTGEKKNKQLHMILMLCEGTVRDIPEVWVNDYSIPKDWIDEDGNVTEGRYKDKLVIRKHFGSPSQVADPVAVTNMPEWTTAHRLQGIAYLYLILTKDQDVYPTGVPNFSAVVEGQFVYDPRIEENTWSTNNALFCADNLRSQRYGFNVLDDDINFTNIIAQANICDEIVDTDEKDYELKEINTATNIITLKGDLLDLQYGDRVEVKSTGTLPAGISAVTDYYVIPYQVKDTPRILLATSLSNSMAKISIDITSAGTGTITVTKTGEPRYHSSGVLETDQTRSANLNNLVNGMAGRAIYTGGMWTLLAGAWRTPSAVYGIGDMRGSGMSFKNDLSMTDSYNIVKGLYLSPLNLYQTSDYPSATYSQFIEDDAGVAAEKEINLPFTQRPTTAQRIAKIELFRGRQGITFASDFSMKAIQNQPGDNIGLDVDRLGWEEKPFEITEFTFDVNDGNLVTRMSLRETAQAIFDWSQGEAINVDPAPNTSMPNPFEVAGVTGVGYNSRIIDTREGDVVYTMTLQWDEHSDQFVLSYGDFEIQYKLESEIEWRPSFFVDGSLTKTDVVNSSVNIPYDLRIRARNNLGVRSAWTTILGAVVGSSGGITDTRDYESVADPVVYMLDYGSVADPVGSGDFEDWGYVN